MNASPLSNICQEMKEGKRSTTDLVWSLKIFNIDRTLVNKNEPVLYHLKDGPKRGFVGEELQIGPLSCLRKKFVDLKKTNKKRVSQQILAIPMNQFKELVEILPKSLNY